MLDRISRQRHRVVKAQSLIRIVRRFRRLHHLINLLLGISTRFRQQNLCPVNRRRLDILKSMRMNRLGNPRF